MHVRVASARHHRHHTKKSHHQAHSRMKRVTHNLCTRCKACMHATNSEIRMYFIIIIIIVVVVDRCA